MQISIIVNNVLCKHKPSEHHLGPSNVEIFQGTTELFFFLPIQIYFKSRDNAYY